MTDCFNQKSLMNSESPQQTTKASRQYRRSSRKGSKQEWPCPFEGCSAILFSKSSQFRHRRLHEQPQSRYQCEKCPEKFVVKLDLMDHIRRSHLPAESYVVCEKCDRTFSSLSNLNAHMGIHKDSGVPQYTCYVCNVAYFHRSALRRHQRADHNIADPSSIESPKQNDTRRLSMSGSSTSGSEDSYTDSQSSTVINELKEEMVPSTVATTTSSSTTIAPTRISFPMSSPMGVHCPFCPSTFIKFHHFQVHLENLHFLSASMQCIINSCGTVCKNKLELEEHRRLSHPYFTI